MKSTSNYLLLKKGLLLFAILLSCHVSIGQTKVEQIDKLVSTYNEYGKFNGSVLVSDQGKAIYKKGFGMANMELVINF